jgi:hypothetical protein
MTDSLASPPTRGGARTVEPSLFRILVDSEMRKAQRLRYCISVICVCAKAVATELSAPARSIEQFRAQLRATDVIAPWPPASLVVLLIDAESRDIPAVMRRITLPLAEGSWGAGSVSYPRATQVADDMLQQAASLMERAIQDPIKHLYIA